MQKITGKEIIVRKSEVKSLLADALRCHDQCEFYQLNAITDQTSALFWAFLAGIRLNQIKPSIPSGDWMNWVEFNFCKPRESNDRTARNYMKIASENSELISRIDWLRVAEAEIDYQVVAELKFDTIRKYRIGFVPEKEQPEHDGNFKFPRLASMVNIVNEFERIFSRHIDGLQLMDLDEVREDTGPLYRFLKCVHERPEQDPFTFRDMIDL